MYDGILVLTDGSVGVTAAIDQAFRLTTTYDAMIHALYVVDDSRSSSGLVGLDDRDPLEPLRQEGETAGKAIARKAKKADLAGTTAVRQHTPHQGIRSYADEQDIDLIVMSSRGHSGISRALFGSVTERVLRVTDRQVLVIDRETPDASNE